jgi:hypothetical protein
LEKLFCFFLTFFSNISTKFGTIAYAIEKAMTLPIYKAYYNQQNIALTYLHYNNIKFIYLSAYARTRYNTSRNK